MKLFVKRMLSVALAACMAIGSAAALSAEKIGDLTASFAVKAAAATIVDSGKCGDNVTYTLDSDGLLTISGKGSMYEYSSKWDGDKYFTTAPWGSKKLTQVVISDGVTSIGKYAFYGCSSLTSITIPDSVTSIGSEAFSGCTGLTSITIPDGVTSISYGAFKNCKGLTGITLGNGVTSIGISAFSNCESLTSITIPDSVTSIGISAFSNCESLTSITIPDSVTSIGDGAFSVCSSLMSITIPNSVTSIGNHAFAYCSNLLSLTIPNSVISIGSDAFYMVSNIVYSGTASGSPWGARALNGYIEDGIVYEDSSKTKLLACPSSREGAVAIPNSVTSIGDRAFYDCDSLTSITIPSGVTSISEETFYSCDSLTSITIPDGVTSIGEGTFYDCRSLTSIAIPDGVTRIGSFAFCGCTGLMSITIPNSVTSIGECAFYGCTGLTSITIPDTVTEIGEFAFRRVPNVIYSGTVSDSPWGARALNGYIEDGLVYEDSSKTKLLACPSSREGTFAIPDSVTSIGNYAFFGCSSLTSITIPDSVTSIGSWAFDECSSLTSVTIGNSVTRIGGGAFSDCRSLNKVYAASLDSWLKIKFSGWGSNPCNNGADLYFNGEIVKDVVIPDGVTSIGNFAFHECSSLTSITIPDSVTDIGYQVFSYCSSLTSITIGSGVTSIGESAFAYCTGLTSITIPNSVTSIGDGAFNKCSSLTSITIPDSVTNIGVRAFYECSSMSDVFILNPNCLTEESTASIFPSVATIHSHSGYGVEKYAKEHRYNFVSLCTWDSGTVTREPQVGVAGERTFTCTVCSATRTEEISPLVPSVPDRIEVKSSDSAKELNDGIVGATHSVTISELLASSNASFIVDKDGNRIDNSAKTLATGMKIILESGGERLEKVISVLGDVNGDGEVSVSDARGALRAAVGLDTLEGAYLNAARVNGSTEVAVSDARSILRAAVALDTGKDWLANIK